MFQRRFGLKTGIVAIVPLLLLGASATSAAAEKCDRACMTGLLTQYVDALVAKDPSKLPLAEKTKITEDGKAIKLGDGIWKSVTSKGNFRHDYLDVKKQVAAAHVVVMEGQTNALCSILLHIEDRKIAGIETLIQRVGGGETRFKPTELDKPVKGMNDPIPSGKKQSRESMIKTALTYTEGLRVGSFIDGGTPFASETYRVENGVITAGGNCGRGDCGMYAQNIMVHPSILASVAAVDEENGVVVLWMNFGHTGSSYGEGNSLVTYEAFKVWGGQIHAINAFFKGMPIGTARFWPSSDPVSR